MNKTIYYKEKTNFGTTHFYVVSEHKDAIKRLVGRPTITSEDAKALQELGFNFQLQQPFAKLVLDS
jgi:hypothetical protein